ncbi:MAG: glycosyltransferase [Gammaproteobacteria bacterium]|nr:glycosyltransferase [Gammaproteobacteria bacterium]
MNTLFHLITGGTPGLRQDAEIAQAVLHGKYPVSTHMLHRGNLHLPHRQLALALRKPFSRRKNIMLFFENLSRSWMHCSDLAILIPNQEWMRPLTTQLIRNCHEIWCKTRYAEHVYRERGFATRHIGFSSRDQYLPEVAKDYTACVHIPGRSELKGTATLLKVWKRHPEWPTLTVITRHPYLRQHCAANIEIVTDFLDPGSLQMVMNRSGIHICPSETEGFGHYISEALSTKAVVITTHAPPMNELVQEDFGFLAESARRIPIEYGERFQVGEESLEQAIARALALTHPEKARMGNLARDSFLANRAQFETRFLQAIANLAQN